jgi:hypothetical protein
MKGTIMQGFNSINKTSSYLSYYELVLSLDADERPMGRVTHLQIIEIPPGDLPEGISHVVRFYDGAYHRELPGKVRPDGDGDCFLLDMGKGKTYRFKKLQCGALKPRKTQG